MSFLSESDQKEIREMFKELVHPVKIINFTQALECTYCRETRQILEEVAQLSDKIQVEFMNFLENKEKADQYGIENQIPAIILEGEKDYGIRYYGIPSGYEFSTLIEDILMVSKRDSGLKKDTRDSLATITKPVNIRVFVTPTCPYCPSAAITAHRMAMESDMIKAEVIESIEFPFLAQKYGVYGVPKVVINDKVSFEGALPEEMFLDYVLKAIK
ncbi:MAG TPA: thioredoxin family protein [Candidatus Hydrothermia bacterium]|nr:thioredoxin family protein [Candidatus Hydrothermae bacterium]MDD3648547.1 thioredoxin family protein [Candidatus Hydrothermia bacterium]MDD5572712.1 thioredoxin family protein [Candidatus Hydrothermia bacterium]HOK22593.1 thioredoxin family protein [Candidatus Hydrothermia bacterium]HOL23300.1 thioredoxin family protein [Candidatus Hydrothermia bacterium]